jgi:hypothetical protein
VGNGDQAALIKESTSLQIRACSGPNCKLKEITEYLKRINVEVMFLNANFDPKSITSPVNFYHDFRLNEQIVAGICKNFVIEVRNQKAELVDDYLGQTKKIFRFFEVQDFTQSLNRYNESSGVLLEYKFQASAKNTRYSRSVFNLFDLASRIGGVFSAMHTGGFMFTSAFSYRLMMSSLISKLFHFRPKFQMETRQKKSKSMKGKKKYTEIEVEDPVKKMRNEYKFTIKERGESLNNSKRRDSDPQSEDEMERKEDPIMTKEKKAMRHLIRDKRAKFNFKTTDILKSICCCRYYQTRQTLRKTPSGRVILNYKLGLEHIDKDLDIGNIIKKIRTLNFFMKIILEKDQRKLLKLRSSKLIHSDEEWANSIFMKKKYVNQNLMLDLFVDNLRRKLISDIDIKMLKITGLSEIIDILKFREKYLIKLRQGQDESILRWKEGVNYNDLYDIMAQELDIKRPQ